MIEQVWIALTGLVAVGLSQSSLQPRRKWASIFGLAGQPAWFYTTFIAEQWGIFLLSFLYAYFWAVGFYNHWLRN